MINKLPIIGWALSLIGSASMSVPFWLCWTFAGIGARYFYWLPPVYQDIGFWQCVGLFVVISILKGCFPVLVTVSQANTNSGK